jgi:hypothetical protein
MADPTSRLKPTLDAGFGESHRELAGFSGGQIEENGSRLEIGPGASEFSELLPSRRQTDPNLTLSVLEHKN